MMDPLFCMVQPLFFLEKSAFFDGDVNQPQPRLQRLPGSRRQWTPGRPHQRVAEGGA